MTIGLIRGACAMRKFGGRALICLRQERAASGSNADFLLACNFFGFFPGGVAEPRTLCL
jgi:hypothetical protein